jgi:hypothetical protein
MNDPQATSFLSAIRKPLLTLHKAILDHERAVYEQETGPVTPAAFLQALINSAGFRWLSPLSTVIARVDEVLDDKDASDIERIGAAEAVAALFSPAAPDNPFLPHYLGLLQANATILHAHGKVSEILRTIDGKPAVQPQ